jgi:flavin reductase (DIM6/NTAB) family NADH-FMN oxidoreductase RutF
MNRKGIAMKSIKIEELSKDLLHQLAKGAFLTVKNEKNVNTMTIGWGSVGYIWNKPILMVPVRYSRHTYTLINHAETFTVSVPVTKNLKDALALCGTKSGKNLDKIKACGLTLVDAKSVETPIIGECDLHIECKVVYKQAMEPGNITEEIRTMNYPQNDFHVLFYGEIVSAYYI